MAASLIIPETPLIPSVDIWRQIVPNPDQLKLLEEMCRCFNNAVTTYKDLGDLSGKFTLHLPVHILVAEAWIHDAFAKALKRSGYESNRVAEMGYEITMVRLN